MTITNFTPLNLERLNKNYLSSVSSSVNKEVEPLPKKEIVLREKAEDEEIIDKEIAPYVRVKPERIKLPPAIEKIGVSTPKKPLKFSPYYSTKLPISDEKVLVGLKAPISSSFRWLATLAVYILKMAHLQLKVVKGRVVRVFRP